MCYVHPEVPGRVVQDAFINGRRLALCDACLYEPAPSLAADVRIVAGAPPRRWWEFWR